MGDVYFAIIPVAIVIVILKICLIGWRVWAYNKRREQRQLLMQQQRARIAAPTARVVAVRRIECPDGMAQQTTYAIEQPGRPVRQVTRTIVVRPTNRRAMDPNLPPTYDQAVTGADRSVKVEGRSDPEDPGDTQVAQPTAPPEINPQVLDPTAPLLTTSSLPPPPPPSSLLPPPPAYTPTGDSVSINVDSESLDDDERRQLLA